MPSVSRQISSAVVWRWISGLAGFSNCCGMKALGCSVASSSALRMAPRHALRTPGSARARRPAASASCGAPPTCSPAWSGSAGSPWRRRRRPARCRCCRRSARSMWSCPARSCPSRSAASIMATPMRSLTGWRAGKRTPVCRRCLPSSNAGASDAARGPAGWRQCCPGCCRRSCREIRARARKPHFIPPFGTVKISKAQINLIYALPLEELNAEIDFAVGFAFDSSLVRAAGTDPQW